MKSTTLAASAMTEPGKLAGRNERQRLVGGLEDQATLVELITPAGLVSGDAGVQQEVVVPAGNGDRVELNGSELSEDFERTGWATSVCMHSDSPCGPEIV